MKILEKQLKKLFNRLRKNSTQVDNKWLTSTRKDLKKLMKEHPYPKNVRAFKVFNFKPVFAVVSIVLLVVLVGSGSVLASQNSLPGDILYPIKIAAEKITIAVNFSPEKKAGLHIQYADNRFKELEKISTQPAKDTRIKEQTIKAINTHMNAVDTQIQKISQPNKKAETALTFVDLIKAQEEDIYQIKQNTDAQNIQIINKTEQINQNSKQKVTETLVRVEKQLSEKNEYRTTYNRVVEQLEIIKTGEVIKKAHPNPGTQPSNTKPINEVIPIDEDNINKSLNIKKIEVNEIKEGEIEDDRNKTDEVVNETGINIDGARNSYNPSVGGSETDNTQEENPSEEQSTESAAQEDNTKPSDTNQSINFNGSNNIIE